jgi:quercetin dioxygenase-like cupin family protein
MIKDITPKFQFTYDGAIINIYHADKGEGLSRHSHLYAHSTFCCSGKMAVRKEGKEVIFDKNTQPANLVANEWHEIEALEDGTVFINTFSEGKI